MKRNAIVVGILAIVFIITHTQSQVPRLISYQGVLTDTSGNVKPDGIYNITFRLYDAAIGGNMLWSETQALSVEGGLMYATLGNTTSLGNSLAFDVPYYLEIQVENEPALSPRIRLTSSPYSFRSIYSDTAMVVKSGSTISRPINPPVSNNEIANKTVVRSIKIKPLPFSDSISTMTDNLYLIGGRNVTIRQEGDTIKILSDTTAGNTLDMAYDQGGPGAGRLIIADAGSVNIIGEDGLEIYGKNHVLTASTHNASVAGEFQNYGIGNAIYASITSDKNPKNAIFAENLGDISSSAIRAVVPFGEGNAGRFIIEEIINKNNALEAITNGYGLAGLFIQENLQNTTSALKAWNKAESNGIIGISKDIARRYSLIYKGGVVGTSNNFFGVIGASDTSSGVLGITGRTGTFYGNGIWDIDAGVLGLTTNVSTVDNFAVAGVATGYGTGVLGIGAGEGHGIIGISGTAQFETTASIRGITREDSAGSNAWPPYFELHEKDASYNKGKVGVLGQSVKKYGVWGESIRGIGVVGTTGRRSGSRDVPNFPVGLLGLSFTADGPAILGGADSSYAGFFVTGNTNNIFPVVKIESAGLGGSLEGRNNGNKGNAAAFYNLNINNDSSAVFIQNQGTSDALKVFADGTQGRALNLHTNNSNNNDITLKVSNYGKNDAAYFFIPNQDNNRVAVYAETRGLGYAGVFKNSNVNNNNSIFMVDNAGTSRAAEIKITNSNSSGTALNVSTIGAGRAGEFSILNTGWESTCLYVGTNGKGSATELGIFNTANNKPVTKVYNQGLGRGLEVNLDNSSNSSAAVYGFTIGRGPAGFFQQSNSSATSNAVQVWANNSQYALQVTNTGTNNNAGYFSGRVVVTGNLSKGSGSFMIDHPQDPENKYLFHSFVESPDMKNIYDGVIKLDDNGEAIVELPAYFEELNMDFRYQLTPIGASAPTLYIADEINNNKFKIAGGKPGIKVSWQVTGIRKDKFAEKNRIQVEVEKQDDEKGTYLHPEVFGKPLQMGVNYKTQQEFQAPIPSPPPVQLDDK